MVDEVKSKSKTRGTRSSSFGVSKRENHDSSSFYSRKLYSGNKSEKIECTENTIPENIIDQIHGIDSRDMSILPDSSIHLMVTSPPYNVGKDYDTDSDLDEYRELLRNVFQQTYRKLVPGGRACINVANLGRKPYIPLHSYIIQDMLDLKYLMRGEILWDKGAGAGVSCAWGSYKSAQNPVLRDTHEYILIFSKENYGRVRNDKQNSIKKEEFLEFTKSIWRFSPESARKVKHPAPFPVELPYRLIQLYTFEGDIVLDPFCGSGTTCVAALETNRHFVGFDNSEEYVKIAKERVAKASQKLEGTRSQLLMSGV
ncbi:SAM-dependent methyltransferase [Dehalococcoides mccartyi]|jgi:site-specific DNA-methyltransferase (adenine-specific)|uniref:DNA-methyltransferase n=1 Tax=Dehalococcoides mccartyi TaxID=61435 RepID=UPI00099DE30E|nr:site-specific DNA-methyltransferase [Dehalococcoides mccartyi]AQX74566.1 SAM-dependent methyltransferase [Dehalococcoides mccartyi]AQY73144.1 SAM-dependent methyltransferase [Dehalococcoides mccartyi]